MGLKMDKKFIHISSTILLRDIKFYNYTRLLKVRLFFTQSSNRSKIKETIVKITDYLVGNVLIAKKSLDGPYLG